MTCLSEAQVDFILTEHAFAPKLEGFPIRYTDCEICGVETPSWKRNAVADPERPAYVVPSDQKLPVSQVKRSFPRI